MSEPKTREEMLKAAAEMRDICRRWDEGGGEKTSAYWRISSSAAHWEAMAAGRKPR